MPADDRRADAGSPEAPIVTSAPLGGSALSRYIQEGRAPAEWQVNAPATPAAWRERIHATKRAFDTDRWWHAIAPAVSASGAGRARLDRVVAAGGVLVTTGQQPGLFGGPVYTVSKALSALALADEIERVTGVAAAPLFWAATDDADLLEAQQVWVSLEGGAQHLRGSAEAPAGTPASIVPQGNLQPQLAALRAASGSALHGAVLAAAEEAYGDPQRTIGNAYLALLETLLAPLGIAVLDAAHPAVGEAGRPLLVAALERAAAVDAALQHRSASIRAEGLEPQVADVAGLTTVFVYEAGAKRRVPADEAADIVARNGAAALGPNVLLRPVMEATILPTVAYVAGPGELAYFTQVTAVADAVGARIPVAIPRWSGVIIEPRMERLLSRLGVPAGALADPHAVEGLLAQRAMPPAVAASLATAADSTAALVQAIRDADATQLIPVPVLDGVEKRVAQQFVRLERRARAAVKRREAMLMRDVATARGYFHPAGTAQERALSVVPFLARSGPVVLERMLAEARRHAAKLVADGAAGVLPS